ncbi:MAG: HAMP domain-containing protein, partial [Gordonibacter urolithinfaciens]
MRKRRARGGRQGAETAGGAPVANMPTHPGVPSDAAAPARSGRIARLRERWRNASLKTSFMGYMLVFLVAALVLSSVTASVFAALQNEVTADAYETSGLYLYDTGTNALVPARSLAIDQEGNELFVQRADDGREPLPIDNPPASLLVESAQSYPYAYRVETGEGGDLVLEGYLADSSELSAFEGEEGIAVQDVPAYDARARKLFDEWAAKNPDNPYRAFLDTETGSDASESSQFGDLLVSPIGYYAHTVPSEDARALSTLFGLLTFLMFPLWFGACIFAAARRFYRMRLAPGFSTLDAAAAKIADQDLDFSVAYGRSDELGRLAASFEAMRTSLAASQRALWRTAEERKRLNAAFAHD